MKRVGQAAAAVLGLLMVGTAGATAGPTDLVLTSTVTGTPALGAPLTYTYTITNIGPNDALSVFFQESGGGASPIERIGRGVPSAGVCGLGGGGPNTGLVLCSLGTILAGGFVQVTTTATPLAPGHLIRQAMVSSQSTVSSDPNIANNQAINSTLVTSNAPVDLQLTGTASTGSPNRGAPFNYTFQLKVGGPFGVGGTTFTAVLPSGVLYNGSLVSSPPGGGALLGTCDELGGVVTCTTGPLLSSGTGLIQLFVNAPITPGNYAVRATASGDVSDPNTANNATAVTVQIK